jgi:hypothetical protein
LIAAVIAIFQFLKKTFLLLIFKPVVNLIRFAIFTVILLGRGLFTLVKFVFKVLLFIIKILFVPIKKIILILWKLLPKGLKKNVEKLYNRMAGNFKKIKNFIVKWMEKWKKGK